MKKKITIVVLSMLVTLLMMTCIASADDEGRTAYVSISLAGTVECVNEEVQAEDANGNGVVDIDDAIKAVSDARGKTYTSEDQGWGICITNLWGDDSGCFGYYLNDGMAMNLEEEITDGAFISVFSYQDTVNWSDSYTFFEEKFVEAEQCDEVTLTLNVCSFDVNWNPVPGPFAGARIMEGETELGTTDENGNITLSLPVGTHIITAYSNSAEQVTVPASAVVSIIEEEDEEYDEGNDEGDTMTGNVDDQDMDEEDASMQDEQTEKTVEESYDTPQTGVDMGLLIVFVLAGIGMCGLVVLRKRIL